MHLHESNLHQIWKPSILDNNRCCGWCQSFRYRKQWKKSKSNRNQMIKLFGSSNCRNQIFSIQTSSFCLILIVIYLFSFFFRLYKREERICQLYLFSRSFPFHFIVILFSFFFLNAMSRIKSSIHCNYLIVAIILMIEIHQKEIIVIQTNLFGFFITKIQWWFSIQNHSFRFDCDNYEEDDDDDDLIDS